MLGVERSLNVNRQNGLYHRLTDCSLEGDKSLPFLNRALDDGFVVAIGDVNQMASRGERGDRVGRVPDGPGREDNPRLLNGHSIRIRLMGLAHGISGVYDAGGVILAVDGRCWQLKVGVLLAPLEPQVRKQRRLVDRRELLAGDQPDFLGSLRV